jgi:hypothetical protein
MIDTDLDLMREGVALVSDLLNYVGGHDSGIHEILERAADWTLATEDRLAAYDAPDNLHNKTSMRQTL